MNKFLSIALLAGGVVLIIYGIKASHSVSTDFSWLFTGSSTDKALWLLIAGVLAPPLGEAPCAAQCYCPI